MASTNVASAHDAGQVAARLALPEIVQLITDLGETRWTPRLPDPHDGRCGAHQGRLRPAYLDPHRPADRGAHRAAGSHRRCPVPLACYRFAVKLRDHGDMLTACIDRVLATLRAVHPQMGQTVAIDGSDLPAYANGQK